ncbi:MAG: DUF927 domain-containing protein [Methanothrix sp.]|nr:DUF927 domain-containing protein [Methanothrix sp.]MCX8206692.1 DUF927 domain-containing protein [Methanothrix sp.]
MIDEYESGMSSEGSPTVSPTREGLLEEALRIVNEICERAERSVQDNNFDPGLPLEPRNIRALAYLWRNNPAEYNRAWSRLKRAKPAPDFTLLKSKIKAQAEVQSANEKTSAENSAGSGLDARYDAALRLMNGIADYRINEKGGLSRVTIEKIFDPATGDSAYETVDTPICDFVAWPVREILKDNGESRERSIELEGILPDSTPLPKICISMSEFSEMKWPGRIWGMKTAIRPFKEAELRFLLQKMAQNGIPESSVYTFLGWKHIDGKWIYLHAGGAIGAENVEIELPAKLQNYRLPETVPDLNAAIKAVIDLFDAGPARIMYPLVSMAFLSPLMEPFRMAGIEPGVLMYLWGPSGSRKSTIIALVLCMFGRFDNKTLPASFRDTPMSIELMAFIAKDVLLAVDDLYPAQDPKEQQKLVGVLEYLMRNQGDRQGRSRLVPGKHDYTLNSGHPPRGLIVASGELQPLSGSSLARAYTLHISPDDLDNDRIRTAQDRRELLSQAMVGYLTWLAPQLDDLSKRLPARFGELRERAIAEAEIQGRHGRLNEAVADMYIGLETFFRYAVESGALTEEEAGNHLKRGWDALNMGADEQTEMAQKGDASQIFFQAISDLLAQNKVYFASMDGSVPIWDREIMPGRRELIGWGPDDDVYYVLMDPAIKAVNELLRGQGENRILRKDILLDAIEQKGLLATPPGKSRSYSKTINKRTRWVTPIKKQAFDMEEGTGEG